jgi:preprotein translocase subunit SecF
MKKSSKGMAVVVAILGVLIAWFFGELLLKEGFAFARLIGVLLGVGMVGVSVYQIFGLGNEEDEEEDDE